MAHTKQQRVPQSFRLSTEAVRIIKRQARRMGVTRTAVIEMALRQSETLAAQVAEPVRG